MFLLTREILIRDASHAQLVNQMACQMPFDVWAHGENHMADAKSLLSLYVLVGKRVHIVVEDCIGAKRLDRLVRAMCPA